MTSDQLQSPRNPQPGGPCFEGPADRRTELEGNMRTEPERDRRTEPEGNRRTEAGRNRRTELEGKMRTEPFLFFRKRKICEQSMLTRCFVLRHLGGLMNPRALSEMKA